MEGWVVVENGKRRPVTRLSEEELRLSIYSIWPVQRLLWALEYGWRPEMDLVPGQVHPGEDDSLWSTPPARMSGHTVHYFYVDSEKEASTLAACLSQAGFDGECAHVPEVDQWVVRVPRPEPIGTPAFDEIEQRLREIADQVGAEYDGWRTVAT